MNNISFWRGNLTDYIRIENKDANRLYFVRDENKIYLGNSEISNNDVVKLLELEDKKKNISESIYWEN